jgi:hypothetical protein
MHLDATFLTALIQDDWQVSTTFSGRVKDGGGDRQCDTDTNTAERVWHLCCFGGLILMPLILPSLRAERADETVTGNLFSDCFAGDWLLLYCKKLSVPMTGKSSDSPPLITLFAARPS